MLWPMTIHWLNKKKATIGDSLQIKHYSDDDYDYNYSRGNFAKGGMELFFKARTSITSQKRGKATNKLSFIFC